MEMVELYRYQKSPKFVLDNEVYTAAASFEGYGFMKRSRNHAH